jgi:hypothetical protein
MFTWPWMQSIPRGKGTRGPTAVNVAQPDTAWGIAVRLRRNTVQRRDVAVGGNRLRHQRNQVAIYLTLNLVVVSVAVYAEYVQTLEPSAEYLDHARIVVRDTAEFLYNELVADGRKGACVDISGVVLRLLERQGIWCHVVCGGVRVEFPAESGIRTRRFYPLMHRDNHAFTGHAWIYAPQ